jgi:hypothetical protein
VPRVLLVLLFLLVIGGTAVAFAVTESKKLETAEVSRTRFVGPDGQVVVHNRVFSPVCDCDQAVALLEFRLRRADRVTASIVGSSDEEVRRLIEGKRLTRGTHQLAWDGRDDAGAVVPDGPYRLRISLVRAGRVFPVPMVFRVDTRAPDVTLVRAGPTRITPNGDGKQDKVWVRYVSSENAAPRLAVGGTIVSRGAVREAGRSALSWLGRVDGVASTPGDYELFVTVKDRAGNVSTPIGPIEITLTAGDGSQADSE